MGHVTESLPYGTRDGILAGDGSGYVPGRLENVADKWKILGFSDPNNRDWEILFRTLGSTFYFYTKVDRKSRTNSQYILLIYMSRRAGYHCYSLQYPASHPQHSPYPMTQSASISKVNIQLSAHRLPRLSDLRNTSTVHTEVLLLVLFAYRFGVHEPVFCDPLPFQYTLHTLYRRLLICWRLLGANWLVGC